MNNMSEYVSMLREQCARWPALTAQDLTKALYQSQFGCGHFVPDPEKAYDRLMEEYETASASRKSTPPLTESLGSSFCRVHLSAMKEAGLAPGTLSSLFVLSAAEHAGSMDEFHRQLTCMEQMIAAGELPVDPEQASSFLAGYRAAGYPATHHSGTFRAAYSPAYRVIRADYAAYLPLFCAIDRLLREKEHVIVAIEGGSASGKSTLGALIQRVYDCNLFHMDDFFLQLHQRTPERFAEPGGNVDYERFSEEVLDPLLRGDAFSYRVFDCSCMALGSAVAVTPCRLNVVEGAYSMHPALSHAYDLSVFLDIDPAEQADRILRRNGPAMQKRFLSEWIPLEHRYFDATDVRSHCTMIL